MSESKVNFTSEQANGDREVASNLSYFWERQGRPDLSKMSAYDKRIIFDVPLLLYQDMPVTSDAYPAERNYTVKKFAKLGWIPKSAAEIRMVTARDEEGIFETFGPSERLRRATHTGTGEKTEAQKSTYNTMSAYLKDAMKDRSILLRARNISRQESVGDISLIRSDPEILKVIGDYLHGRELLDRGLDYDRHTTKFKNGQRLWRGFMEAAVQPGFANDEAILAIFEKVWQTARSRAEYWREQQQAAYKKVGNVLIRDVQETIIPVKIVEYISASQKEERPTGQADTLRPWENYKPSVRPGENYQLGGMDKIPHEEKSEKQQVKPIPSGPLPKPLFKTSGDKAKKKSPRPRRPIKPSERKKPGYDHERDPSNPQPF